MYHTNVMMAVGTDVAVVCADSVQDTKERQNLLVSGMHSNNVSFCSFAYVCRQLARMLGCSGLVSGADCSQAECWR